MNYKSMIYRLFSILAIFFFTAESYAQEAATKPSKPRGLMELLLENIILIMGAVVVVAAFATIIYLFNMLLKLQERRMLQEQGIEVVEPTAITQESWWQSFSKRMAGTTVSVEKEEDILMGHVYDGIRELDNSLPPWWLAMFYLTVIFAVVYVGYYEFSDQSIDQIEEYALEMEYAERAQMALLAKQANKIDESSAEIVEDPAFIAVGKDIFDKNCVACHGALGEGNTVGPNLTDEYWLHGGSIKDVFKTIKYGVVEKGMQSWKEALPPTAIHQVSNYILSLQGSNPPNAKEPQGEIYKVE